jgi:hypothetical protein
MVIPSVWDGGGGRGMWNDRNEGGGGRRHVGMVVPGVWERGRRRWPQTCVRAGEVVLVVPGVCNGRSGGSDGPGHVQGREWW